MLPNVFLEAHRFPLGGSVIEEEGGLKISYRVGRCDKGTIELASSLS